MCVCHRGNCTLLGTSVAPHGLSTHKSETARPSRTPSKPAERVAAGLRVKHTPVKSRTDTPHKLTVAKEPVVSSPQKRRNISRPLTRTEDKPEVIGKLVVSFYGPKTGGEYVLIVELMMHRVKEGMD